MIISHGTDGIVTYSGTPEELKEYGQLPSLLKCKPELGNGNPLVTSDIPNRGNDIESEKAPVVITANMVRCGNVQVVVEALIQKLGKSEFIKRAVEYRFHESELSFSSCYSSITQSVEPWLRGSRGVRGKNACMLANLANAYEVTL